MATVTQMKCACESCLCIVSVSLETAVKKNGKNYCSEDCANGHPDGAGCGHEGCNCNS